MAEWHDALDDMDATCQEVFSDGLASYQPKGGGLPFDVEIVIDRDVVAVGENGQVSDRTTLANIRKSDVPEPRYGDQFTLDGSTYEVQGRAGDDGRWVRCYVYEI